MYKIVTRKQLNDSVVLMEIDAPFIAAKAEAGQFIIYRVDEKGERIPLTIADYDREKGTITIIFQVIGGSTMELAKLNEGDFIHDVVGRDAACKRNIGRQVRVCTHHPYRQGSCS